jgi:hypothetical protein
MPCLCDKGLLRVQTQNTRALSGTPPPARIL